jgi:DNA-binding transcriptional MerR regulator
MSNLTLKAGQVAAALNISTKRLQNTVDAGYLRPAKVGRGRGSERRYSFEDVAPMQALEILVKYYGLSMPRAAQMLSDVWPRRFSRRPRALVIRPEPSVGVVRLEPIKLPLSEIVAAAEACIQQVLEDYQEKKRGRPAGWPAKFTKSLSRVSDALQGVSEEQIERDVLAYRRKRN